jgi:hypothetical protein
MMRQFDDPDVAVSYAAILIFFGALRPVLFLLGVLTRGAFGALVPLHWLYLAAVAAAVAGAIALLKRRRWGWPTAFAGVVVSTLLEPFVLVTGAFGLLFGLLFAGLTIYLLTRPSVRERFGVGRR